MAKAPTGVSISRSGANFTASWKKGEKYSAQKFEYCVNPVTPWTAASTSKDDTSKVVTLPYWNYYPFTQSTVTSFYVRIKGKKDGNWSGFSYSWFLLFPPVTPSITATPDNDNRNACKFSWSASASGSDSWFFIDNEYQSMLVADSNVTDGGQLYWSSTQPGWIAGTSIATGEYSVVETEQSIATGSHTRWFRVRSRGPGGASAWSYAKRVYADPNEAEVGDVIVTDTAAGYQVYVPFSGTATAANPTEQNIVQYATGVPGAGLSVPSGASWTSAVTSQRTGDTDAASIRVNTKLAEDQCLWVRVNTKYQNNTTEGQEKLAKVGTLKAPEITNVATVESTYRATITATNNSTVPDSFLVILYRTKEKPGEYATVGIIPHGENSVTVQCPDWSDTTGKSFGVYAAVGSYEELDRADGVSSYAVDAKMASDGIVWDGGSVPDAPQNVTAVPGTNPGSIYVTWDWTWSEADSAIISWADHDDAWASTDEPDDYTISNLHAGEWTIAGVDTGKTWYVRVRLAKGSGSDMTEGPWSTMVPVDLASAPSVPRMQLSASVIPVDASVTAYWDYVTSDGTGQIHASICEAIVGSGGITYGSEIAHTETAQNVTLYPETLGWIAGTTHYLCVSVTSGSGKTSDRWSDPVAVTIAEPLVATIAQTSLVEETIETNPRTYTGDPVTFDSESVVPVASSLEVELEPIQDLNGYDHPWIGGAGKNVCPTPTAGILVSNSTGVISGTPSDTTVSAVTEELIPVNFSNGAQYTFSYNSWGSEVRSMLLGYNANGEYVRGTAGNATTPKFINADSFTTAGTTGATGDIVYVRVRFYRNDSVNITQAEVNSADVQLEKGAEKTSFAPYENICPIYGTDEVKTKVRGKNIIDFQTILNYWGSRYTESNGTYTVTALGRPYQEPYAFSDTDVAVSARAIIANLTGASTWRIDLLKADGSVSASVRESTPVVQNVVASKIRLNYSVGGSGATYKDVQLELGSTATDYEPYQRNDYTTDLGRTVYGGTLDVVSGLLTVDRVKQVINGSTTVGLLRSGTTSSLIQAIPSAYLKQHEDAVMPIIVSDCLPTKTSASIWASEDVAVSSATNGQRIWMRLPNITTEADARTYLTSSPLTVVYELATPQTYQLTPQQISLLLGTNNVWSDGEITLNVADSIESGYFLKEMPLTVTVMGAGQGGNTTVAIERAEGYHVGRPDETDFNGYKGETTALIRQSDEGQLSIPRAGLIGALDDGARYILTATVQDGLGQHDTDSIPFTVRWDHQAVIPEATVAIDGTVAKITPTQPESGYAEGDTVDIYRLSADKPELVYEGAEFGTTYVDPYPSIGQYGGYRIVYKTKDGDYITRDNELAWTDYEAPLDIDNGIIDYNGVSIPIRYNLDLSNKWEKGFKQTVYLGGSVQGDWNRGVSRTETLSSVTVISEDPSIMRQLRALADYPGVCHLRTPDGSSFDCDIQISDAISYESGSKINSFSLNVTRIDTEEPSGMALEEWEEGDELE